MLSEKAAVADISTIETHHHLVKDGRTSSPSFRPLTSRLDFKHIKACVTLLEGRGTRFGGG